MGLLRFALKKERWDLAAYTIVLATVRVVHQRGKPDDRKSREKKVCAKG
jgi:hypothetical protein